MEKEQTSDVLPQEAFRRYDDEPDERFYQVPRLVTHIDDQAIAAVTALYRQYFPPGGEILDLMSSWVSHLPPEVSYKRVVGVGMNPTELDANPRLNERIVQNLNQTPDLPLDDGSFDGAAICVSIQYLTQPARVLREVGRVLRPGAPLVVTFSNRCFPTKAVAVWQALNNAEHTDLVAHYLREAGYQNLLLGQQRELWADITRFPQSLSRPGGDPLFAVVARRNEPEPA